jgi:hypothetical protein
MAVEPTTLYKGNPSLGTAPTRYLITNKQITSGVATITTSASNGITTIGTLVTIRGVDSTHDGTYAISNSGGSTTFNYQSTTTTQSSTAVSPNGYAIFHQGVNAWTGFGVTNKVVQNYIATLTTTSHSFAVGDFVAVTIGDAIYDGLQQQIIAVPSSSTISYAVSTQTAASTSASGAVGKYPYLYQAGTTTIVTDIVVTNASSTAATFTIVIAGVFLHNATSIAANSTLYISLAQYMTGGTNIYGTASSPNVSFHISGVFV